MLADTLVSRLTVAALLHSAHDELFGRHEGQFLGQTPANSRRVNLEPADDVLHQYENGIRRQKALGNHEPAIRAVVQRPLEELYAVGEVGVRLEHHHKPGE